MKIDLKFIWCITIIVMLIACCLFGCESKHDCRDECYVADMRPRMQYKQFFKEVRGTDSPIVDVWIEHQALRIVTEDGNEDCVLLEVERYK